jgi:AhpD family alkylhydroperoxidase
MNGPDTPSLACELDIVDKRSIDVVVSAKRCAHCGTSHGEVLHMFGKNSLVFSWLCAQCSREWYHYKAGNVMARLRKCEDILVHE